MGETYTFSCILEDVEFLLFEAIQDLSGALYILSILSHLFCPIFIPFYFAHRQVISESMHYCLDGLNQKPVCLSDTYEWGIQTNAVEWFKLAV